MHDVLKRLKKLKQPMLRHKIPKLGNFLKFLIGLISSQNDMASSKVVKLMIVFILSLAQ